MRITVLLIFFLFLHSGGLSQTSPHAAAILQRIEKLNTCGSVLYIAAHPDDENTRLLSYLANEKKLRTAYLSLTRGDGGQNLIGKEQAEALGVLRTQELLAARKIDGAEQFFTRAYDFGFSKRPEETLAIWNRDSVLSDMVYIIRKFKPDVIICRFPTTGEGGHGHHTASAILALEAAAAAADPAMFSKQLGTVQTWKTRRIFWNTFNFSSRNTTSPDQLKIDVGLYNPLLGKSYGEIAAESRSMHKSQGFGTARVRGSVTEYFKQLQGDSAKCDLFENINTGWERMKEGRAFGKKISAIIRTYDTKHPESSIPRLAQLYRELSEVKTEDGIFNHWRNIKLKEIADLLLSCSGTWLEVNSSAATLIPGSTLQYSVQVVKRLPAKVRMKQIIFPVSDTLPNLVLKENTVYTFRHIQPANAALPYSGPYWLSGPRGAGLFSAVTMPLTGQAANAPVLSVQFLLEFNGVQVPVSRPVAYKSADPVKGEYYQPLEVLPPVTIDLPEKAYVFASGGVKKIRVQLRSNVPQFQGKLRVIVSEGWKAAFDSALSFSKVNEEKFAEIVVAPGTVDTGRLEVTVESEGRTFRHGIRRITYDHIPPQFMLTEPVATLVKADVRVTAKRVGYIPGAGDEIPAALAQMGCEVDVLPDELLATADLSRYDAIVTGVRAYNTNENLRFYQDKLLAYVKNGGNLLVQYNTNSHVGPLQGKIGPYPFVISRERVTDENATVNFLNPEHPALNLPNKLGPADFENWVQERGIYFATETDQAYETIIAFNDPGEKSHPGSVIIGRYGKGNFIYTGLSFFRQLPAGNPGAYRLFANLISLRQNEKR